MNGVRARLGSSLLLSLLSSALSSALSSSALLSAAACKTAPVAGPAIAGVAVTAYGEEDIEDELPAAPADDQPGVADGWSIRFDKFLVVLSDLRVGGARQEERTALSPGVVVDVHMKGPTELADLGVLAPGLWDRVSVSVAPAAGAASRNAGAADVAMMNQKKWSVYVAGSATKERKTVKFAWGFATTTRYEDCQDSTNHAGVFVEEGKMPSIQFTIQGAHLFLDDLGSPYARPRAGAIAAADADGDGFVTLEELAKVRLSSLPPVPYANTDESVKTLADLVTALTRSIVRFQGEGECATE